MYRIMIVEDDEVIARAVQQSLVSWGMDAFCVQDFSGVLAEFAVKNPQLVLMDIHLPFFNGFHWCQVLPLCALHLPRSIRKQLQTSWKLTGHPYPT